MYCTGTYTIMKSLLGRTKASTSGRGLDTAGVVYPKHLFTIITPITIVVIQTVAGRDKPTVCH